jgi:dGTPase
VQEICAPAERIVEELFTALHARPHDLPAPWQARLALAGDDAQSQARIIADYVAGMTDRFAIHEHQRLTGRQLMPVDNYF